MGHSEHIQLAGTAEAFEPVVHWEKGYKKTQKLTRQKK